MEQLEDDLMLMLVKRIIEDRPLSDIDVKKFQQYLYNVAVFNREDENEVKLKLKKFNQAIPNFLKKVSVVLAEAEATHTKIYRMMMSELERTRTLPPLATSFDHPDLVKFINSLTEEYYSFSAAEKLVGTARQTLANYAEAKTNGLKVHFVGRSKRLLKEDLISYYRLKYFSQYDHFKYITDGENYARQFGSPIRKRK